MKISIKFHEWNNSAPPWCKELLSSFWERNKSLGYNYKKLAGQDISSRRFLAFCLENGVECESEISMLHILKFKRLHINQNHFGLVSFLSFLETRNPYIMFLLPLGYNALYASRYIIARDNRCNSNGYTVQEFYATNERIVNYLIKEKYSYSYINHFTSAIEELSIFLIINKLNFNLQIAEWWCSVFKENTKCRLYEKRICFDICYKLLNKVPLEDVFARQTSTELPNTEFPEYVLDYLTYRKENGCSKSTLSLDRIAICRFLLYIKKSGYPNINDVTINIIKDFNISDTNFKSTQSKNAYNTRIRIFLKYLADREIIQQYLPEALTCVACNKRKPVETLSEEREKELNAIIQSPSGSRTYYRDLSIYKLCRYLGLRISDACKIRFTDINISKMELYIIQKKTGKQIVMPLLPDILNTILKYLKCERPDCQCEYIFLKSVAPYGKINSLGGIIANLFNWDLTKSHILRRTFASELLQKGAKTSLVADSLGHSDESNIHKYLSLDTNQMRKCPMSVKDIEYNGLLL